MKRISCNKTQSHLPLNSRICTGGTISTHWVLSGLLKNYRKLSLQSKGKICCSFMKRKVLRLEQFNNNNSKCTRYWFFSLQLFSFLHLRHWNVLTLLPQGRGGQWCYWRWCDSGGCNPWLSCDWSQRTQLVLGFCPSSWARVFWSPLQSSLKEDSQVVFPCEALRTLRLESH